MPYKFAVWNENTQILTKMCCAVLVFFNGIDNIGGRVCLAFPKVQGSQQIENHIPSWENRYIIIFKIQQLYILTITKKNPRT